MICDKRCAENIAHIGQDLRLRGYSHNCLQFTTYNPSPSVVGGDPQRRRSGGGDYVNQGGVPTTAKKVYQQGLRKLSA